MSRLMTKKQARAILRLADTVEKACDRAEKDLEGWPDLENARAYWLAHLRSSVSGHAYGSIPKEEAMRRLDL